MVWYGAAALYTWLVYDYTADDAPMDTVQDLQALGAAQACPSRPGRT